MKSNSPLEKLLSKYFEQFQSLDTDQIDVSDFDQQKSFRRIQQKIRNKPNRVFPRLVAAACFLIVCGLSIYLISNQSNPVQVKISSAINEVKEVNLPDGTKVWLNSKSELLYNEKFAGGKTREVFLSGEAYFEVKRNEEKPFIITSQGVKTTVLGTVFNISAYEDDADVTVSVVSGKVAVKEKKKEVVLVKNQQALFDKMKGTLIKTDAVVATQNTLWKEGKLVFNGVKLEKVLATIERNFEAKIVIGEKLKNCKISADFTDLPVDKIVKILGEIVSGSSSFKDNKYYLTGNGCI